MAPLFLPRKNCDAKLDNLLQKFLGPHEPEKTHTEHRIILKLKKYTRNYGSNLRKNLRDCIFESELKIHKNDVFVDLCGVFCVH